MDSKYVSDYETYNKNLNDLKRWKGNYDEEVKKKRMNIQSYLDKPYDNETPASQFDYTVPELFVKIRNRTNKNYEVMNISDLVNHFHYKIMVDREIPVKNKDANGVTSNDLQWSSENIIGLCKMARVRLEPFVRAFINTFELTDPNIRKVYAVRNNNLQGAPMQRSGPTSKFPNNLTGMHAALAANALYGSDLNSQINTYGGSSQNGGMYESLNTASNLFKELNNLSEGYNSSIKDTSNLLNNLNKEYKGMNQSGAAKKSKKKKSKKSSKKKSKKSSKKKC